MSLFLASGGTIGGWALTGKLAGEEAALSFLQVGVVAVLTISIAQFLFFSLGKKRLIYCVLFNITFGFGIVWFLMCLLLPVFWVQTIGTTEKSILALFLVMLCSANACKASTQFKSKWREVAEGALARHYNVKDNSMDWPKVLAPMRLTPALYIPGVPERMNPVISIAIIVSMVTGLSLRNSFPIFSLYAWGIPSCLAISLFIQASGLGVAQIITLAELEKKYGKPIRPKM